MTIEGMRDEREGGDEKGGKGKERDEVKWSILNLNFQITNPSPLLPFRNQQQQQKKNPMSTSHPSPTAFPPQKI